MQPRSAVARHDPNVVPVEATQWDVRQAGLYAPRRTSEGELRWTNGQAVIDVPIDAHHPPTELTLAIASGRVTLGRCTPPGYWARVEVRSDTHSGARDRRPLGVELSRISLE